jgi:hypothetical protein
MTTGMGHAGLKMTKMAGYEALGGWYWWRSYHSWLKSVHSGFTETRSGRFS